jgi:hypothetical protein
MKGLPDLFNRNTPHKLLGGIFGNIYEDFLMETEHPAVTAMNPSRPNISTGEINCFYRYIILY